MKDLLENAVLIIPHLLTFLQGWYTSLRKRPYVLLEESITVHIGGGLGQTYVLDCGYVKDLKVSD